MKPSRTLDVLVVDDETMVLTVLSAIIEELGHTARVAGDGFAALSAMQQRPSHLVITDLSMPGMNGFELVRRVRSLFPDTRMVLMTGHSSDDSYKTAMALDMDAYLTKPFKTGQLTDIFKAVLAKLPPDGM